MRRDLRNYNDLLSRTFIDIPTLQDPHVDRRITTGPRAGGVARVPIGPGNQFVHRVFSRGSWDCNGRFYGGWWQQAGSDLRKKIHINDVPTTEVDFRSMHINILSLERGVPLTDDPDPYDITEISLDGVERREQRKYLKHLLLTAINARDEKAAYKAFRENYPAGSRGKSFKDADLGNLLGAFIARHRQFDGAICTDQGIRLMKIDSEIADRILKAGVDHGIPILSVHDSFIVDYNRVGFLKDQMALATEQVLGTVLPVSAEWMGLDEVEPGLRADYVAARALERTPGYLERQRWFLSRVADVEE